MMIIIIPIVKSIMDVSKQHLQLQHFNFSINLSILTILDFVVLLALSINPVVLSNILF